MHFIYVDRNVGHMTLLVVHSSLDVYNQCSFGRFLLMRPLGSMALCTIYGVCMFCQFEHADRFFGYTMWPPGHVLWGALLSQRIIAFVFLVSHIVNGLLCQDFSFYFSMPLHLVSWNVDGLQMQGEHGPHKLFLRCKFVQIWDANLRRLMTTWTGIGGHIDPRFTFPHLFVKAAL